MGPLLAVRGALSPRAGTAPAAPSAAAPSRGSRFYGLAARIAAGFISDFPVARRLPDEGCCGGGPPHALDAGEAAPAHEPTAAGDAHDVGVDAGHSVVHVVHVRLLDPHQDLVAHLERQRPLLDLLPRAAVCDLERVERQRLAALEVEVLAALLLELVEGA